jgi:putative ABC transport system permease protein
VGFLVGAIICYQILFTDVSHQLAQFGTLRAMGYHDHRIRAVVFEQALLLSLLGFVPGMLLSRGLYVWLSAITGLPMRMGMLQTALVFGLTVTMCVAAGIIASRKALALDPADVY